MTDEEQAQVTSIRATLGLMIRQMTQAMANGEGRGRAPQPRDEAPVAGSDERLPAAVYPGAFSRQGPYNLRRTVMRVRRVQGEQPAVAAERSRSPAAAARAAVMEPLQPEVPIGSRRPRAADEPSAEESRARRPRLAEPRVLDQLVADGDETAEQPSIFFSFPWRSQEAVDHTVLVRMRHIVEPAADATLNGQIQWTLYFLLPEGMQQTLAETQVQAAAINPREVLLEAIAAFNTLVVGDLMSYDELTRLQELMGFVDRGAPSELITEQLPTHVYRARSDADGASCTICLNEYQAGEPLRRLPCKHSYHAECIDKWLTTVNRCPLCRHEAVVKPPADASGPP